MPAPLLSRYDGLICDLDGVVYRGGAAVPGAVEALNAARTAGRAVVYATNNASRPPRVVAEHLQRLGLQAEATDVVNSSMAGADAIALRVRGTRGRVLAVGGPGVSEALSDAGLDLVLPSDVSDSADVHAVLQGYGRQVTAADLAEAAYAIQRGAWWVATNTDATLPTERGLAPGNGMLVGAVAAAVQQEPFVVGKPHTPLYELSLATLGTVRERTLALGDRVDTDVAGARAAGIDAVLVLTGVHGPADIVLAEARTRPRYLLADLGELAEPYLPAQRVAERIWQCAEAVVRVDTDAVDSGELRMLSPGSATQYVRAGTAALCEAFDTGAISRAVAGRLGASLATTPA